MSPPSKKISVIIYFVYLTLFVLVAEFLLLWIIETHHKNSSPVPDYGGIVGFDRNREGGHLLPNLNGWMKGERKDLSVRIITNSKGFRNDHEFAYQPPPNTYRILFLGDSYVDGLRTDQKQTIGYLLEQYLNKNKDRNDPKVYEIMISGHNNPADAWYYYQEIGFKYHPQLVLLGVTLGNDLTWHSYQSSLQPETDSDGIVALKLSESDQPGTGQEIWFPEDAYKPKSQEDFLENFECDLRVFFNALFPLWTAYLVPASYKGDIAPHFDTRRHVQMANTTHSLGLSYKPVPPEIERQYAYFQEVIQGFSKAAENHGSQLALVLFPTRLQSSVKEWELFVKFYSLDKSKFDLAYPAERVQKICHAAQVPYMNLLPAFCEHYSKTNTPLYLPQGDMHFNSAGQALAAKEIYPFIKKILIKQENDIRAS